TLSKSASVSIKIYDKSNSLIKTITISSGVSGSNTAYWDGKNDKGVIVGDGVYTYTIDAADSSGNKAPQAKGTITVDGTPPSIYNHRAEPPVISP
ncbi:MAG TPA: FlgD immunoglobulin-like domain containing protein, partial [Clostridia bacterium]|nr:FlgD immunoglobulin-like domain containing protein [Clostridia bacterium]